MKRKLHPRRIPKDRILTETAKGAGAILVMAMCLVDGQSVIEEVLDQPERRCGAHRKTA